MSDAMKLAVWEQGIYLAPPDNDAMRVYLWFYEWHMFDACLPGQHTRGRHDYPVSISDDGRLATIRGEDRTLTATADRSGAHLELRITNRSAHDWSPLAAIIPCFNPGPPQAEPPRRNTRFLDSQRRCTYFLSAEGAKPLRGREIHYNHDLRSDIDAQTTDGRFAWSDKWPTAEEDAVAGALTRLSDDEQWVCGIGWRDFVSVQGHNPWDCMHVSIHVGPLRRGETRTVPGRMWLFRGGVEDAWESWHSVCGGWPRRA